nr:HAMP domain-containing histidine kinase [Bacteroidales bacterium]
AQLLAIPGVTLSDEEKQSYLDYINANTLVLHLLVDDVLTLNELENGKLKLNHDEFNVNEVCEVAIESMKKQCKEGVKIEFKPVKENNAIINSDRNRILQIMLNFLTNSMKNTEKGSIFVECNSEEIPGHVTLSVTDSGCGVPKDLQDAIFDKFVKVDSFKPGTGLGLTICKRVAQALGGTIILDTKYTTGAKFLLILPS